MVWWRRFLRRVDRRLCDEQAWQVRPVSRFSSLALLQESELGERVDSDESAVRAGDRRALNAFNTARVNVDVRLSLFARGDHEYAPRGGVPVRRSTRGARTVGAAAPDAVVEFAPVEVHGLTLTRILVAVKPEAV
jgi:hypothetical protein